MILFYKRMPAVMLGIAMTCILASCGKNEAPQPADIILQEDFDKAENTVWKPDSTGNIVTAVRDGWFVVSYRSADMGTYSFWAPVNIFPADQQTGSVEIMVRHTAGHVQDKAGLVFWVKNSKNYVVFTIGDKEYRIFQVVEGQTTNLVNWTTSAAIRGKLNEDNKLKVKLTGEKLLFYINDEKMVEMAKGPAAVLDKIGFQMNKASVEVEKSEYRIDYVRVMRD